MSFAYEFIDVAFMLDQEGMYVSLVDVRCALLAGQDQVEPCEEAEPGVERGPDEDEGEEGFKNENDRDDDPVHQPWSELRGVGGAEGFVGREDGKEDGCDGPWEVG